MEKMNCKFQNTILCLFLVIFALMLMTQTASAVERFSFPGVMCSAYNNAQANALERSHVRLLNPSENYRGIYVVCGIPRHTEQASSIGTNGTIDPPYGWINLYFSSGVSSSASCVFREFDRDTVHVPGGTADSANTLNVKTITIAPPGVLPNHSETYFQLANDGGASHLAMFYTLTCALPPGVGIQMINLEEQ